MKLKMNASALKSMISENGVMYPYENAIGGLTGAKFGGLNDRYSESGISLNIGFCTSMSQAPLGSNSVRGLFVMKGAMPTQSEFDTAVDVNGAKTLSGILRYSDLLVYYQSQSAAVSSGSVVCSFTPTAATGSGTAAWFMFGCWSSNYTWGTVPNYIVAGTITGIGGGGDIEMLNTTIAAGTTYRIPQYEMRLPTKFSV
jgi:hypothetical protein